MTTFECRRCLWLWEVIDENGEEDLEQCKRNTCLYSDFCWQHTRIAKGLKIADSTLPGAGKGLVATKSFKQGDVVAVYGGKDVTVAEFEANPSNYAITLDDDLIRDAKSSQSDLGRWSNDCRPNDIENENCEGNNTQFWYDDLRGERPDLFLEAIQDIDPGDEIFVGYGDTYWNQDD
jgi:hypothetical protein